MGTVERLPLSKKLRFEILERDDFTCQYCGAHGDGVQLEIDHIVPIFEGGGDDPNNLTTACFDCNRGKGRNLLADHHVEFDDWVGAKNEKIDAIQLEILKGLFDHRGYGQPSSDFCDEFDFIGEYLIDKVSRRLLAD